MSKILVSLFLILQGCSQSPKLEHGTVESTMKPCVKLMETETKEGVIYVENQPFYGSVCTYFPNGNTHTETSFVNGVKEGDWKVYYENGNLEKSGSLLNGADEGTYLEYYENGQLKYEYHYLKGIKTGVWKAWYPDGGKYTERHFNNNMLHGKVLVWDETGRLAKEYDYLHGKLVNKQMHFKTWEE